MKAQDFRSLGDIVRPISGADPAKVAMIFEEQRLDYTTLDQRSSRMANFLIARGIQRGDRVAILSKNNPACIDILFGTAKAGAALVPLNWRLSAMELGWIIGDSQPGLIFVEHGLEALVKGVSLPVIGFEDRGSARWDAPVDAASVDDPRRDGNLDDLAMLVYTSGTTGHPKGAMIAHRNFIRHCGLEEPEVPYWTGIARDEVCLVVLPLFHVGGLELLLRPLFTAATVVLHRELDLGHILDDVERLKLTMIGLVPTALQMMLEHPSSHAVDFSSVRKFLYGAAPIPLPLLKLGLERIGCDFVGTYGMTESNGVCSMLAPADHRDEGAPHLASVGKPTFDAQIRTVDVNGKDTAVGVPGEILVRGSGVMVGYWRNEEGTTEAIDSGGWLRSGDAGYIDADGFLFICDRVKDMICSGGENIYPAEVESAVFGHPSVAEVAVVGVPDRKWGETVRAVVVAKPGMTIDPAEIIAWARGRIATFKAPKSVDVVDALPKNATGKILRRTVRERVLAELAPDEVG